MRRSAGAIFRDNRPATIIRSDWRGLPRNTSAPNRAMSYREALIAIISIAQHASPNVTGQIDDRRAHCTIFSTVVVRTGISKSAMCYSASLMSPVQHALAPDVDVAREQDGKEHDNLNEPRPPQPPQGHRERIEKRHLDVEQQEDHRDEVELDRVPLPRVPDRWHAALVRCKLLGRGL